MSILIVPISHLAKESRELAKATILEEKPDFVALELDAKRFFSLFSGKHRYVVRPSLSSLVGYVLFRLQKQLGSSVGQKPGAEFVEAARAAAKVKAKVALVDQDIELTLKKLTRSLSLSYLARFVALALVGRRVSFDISRMPSEKLIAEAMADLEKYFPKLYKVFVDERNHLMARRVGSLKGKVVFVVGAGHIAGLKRLLPRAKIVKQALKEGKRRGKHAKKKGKVQLLKN